MVLPPSGLPGPASPRPKRSPPVGKKHFSDVLERWLKSPIRPCHDGGLEDAVVCISRIPDHAVCKSRCPDPMPSSTNPQPRPPRALAEVDGSACCGSGPAQVAQGELGRVTFRRRLRMCRPGGCWAAAELPVPDSIRAHVSAEPALVGRTSFDLSADDALCLRHRAREGARRERGGLGEAQEHRERLRCIEALAVRPRAPATMHSADTSRPKSKVPPDKPTGHMSTNGA